MHERPGTFAALRAAGRDIAHVLPEAALAATKIGMMATAYIGLAHANPILWGLGTAGAYAAARAENLRAPDAPRYAKILNQVGATMGPAVLGIANAGLMPGLSNIVQFPFLEHATVPVMGANLGETLGRVGSWLPSLGSLSIGLMHGLQDNPSHAHVNAIVTPAVAVPAH